MNLSKWIISSIVLCSTSFLFAQDSGGDAAKKAKSLVIEPNPLTLRVGETKQVQVLGLDDSQEKVEGGSFSIISLRSTGVVPSSGVMTDDSGNISGMSVGTFNLVVLWSDENNTFLRDYLTVHVENWDPASIDINEVPEEIPVGSVINLDVQVKDEKGVEIEGDQVTFSSSKPEVLSVDVYSQLRALKPGKAQIEVRSGDIKASLKLEVVPSEVESLSLDCEHDEIRTGDVVYFNANVSDSDGKMLNVPLTYSVNNTGNSAEGSFAIVRDDGAFVAEKPGFYTVNVMAGGKSASRSIKVVARNVERDIEVVGRGTMTNKHTTDFWLWEGVDGRDYAVTGTFSADGMAYFWDITDPSNIQVTDSLQVDARNVNDVKLSEDGRICVISREGASNRKNGIVILDVTNPKDVKVLSEYFEQLTGGVHNLFIYDEHVYALSNGQHYEIINISDPTNPYKVGRFEIDNPARAIHDVWVEDGIAYSSNWNDGVIMVDVGNGVAGGSPSNPVEISRSKVYGDANHTTFPFRSESAGRFYVVAGDEIFPIEWLSKGLTETLQPRGYVHIIDWTEKDNPVEVAIYKVPEAGAHNYWVEDETLYIGYYTGGVRVVDLSGELMGDLYRQGREIGYFVPRDPDGKVPNMAMTWGARTIQRPCVLYRHE